MRKYSGVLIGIAMTFSASAAQSATLSSYADFNSYGRANGPANPLGSLVVDGSGNLFGTSLNGGAANGGAVFKIEPNRAVFTLASFPASFSQGASQVYSGLTYSPDAAINNRLEGRFSDSLISYGGSVFYGTDGHGVFRVSTANNLIAYDNIDQPPNAILGMTNGGVALVASGEIFVGATSTPLVVPGATHTSSPTVFETTYDGGFLGHGSIIELTANIHGQFFITHTINFYGANGSNPYAGLVADGSGNFFGTTVNGGKWDDGTVFELTSTGVLKDLVSFNGTNGANPYGGVIVDQYGNLFGTTSVGGTFGDGTVYKIAKGGGLMTLASFDGSSGVNPYASLLAYKGVLYGTTTGLSDGDLGGVFQVTGSGYGVANIRGQSARDVGAVPELGSWAMMLVGFGAMGGVMRRRSVAIV